MLAALMWIVLALIGVVLVVLLAVLATPWRLEGSYQWPEEETASARLKLLGGLSPWIELSGEAAPKRKKPRMPARVSATRLTAGTVRRAVGAAPELIFSCLSRMRIAATKLEIDYGFEDPSDTGVAYAYLTPVLFGAVSVLPAHISIRPHFNGKVFRGSAAGEVLITPITLVPALAVFAWRVWGPGR